MVEQRHGTSTHSRPCVTVLHELPSAQMGQDHRSKPSLEKAPRPSGHPLAPRVMAEGFPLDRQMDSCCSELWGTIQSQALLTSSLGPFPHLHTGLVLALAGEARGMGENTPPFLNKEPGEATLERRTGQDVQLCQEKGPENDLAFLMGGAYGRSGPRAFLTGPLTVDSVLPCGPPRPEAPGPHTSCRLPEARASSVAS